jgi:outer membrane protein assembly factor BamB
MYKQTFSRPNDAYPLVELSVNKHSEAMFLAAIVVLTLIVFQFAPLVYGSSDVASRSNQKPMSATTPIDTKATTWSTQEVLTGGSFGKICLVLDSENNPHIVHSGANGLMYYTFWDGANWKTQGVIQGATPFTLMLDSKNGPHILFEGANEVTYYASLNVSVWKFQVVPAGNRYSLALDSAGNPHLAFATQLLVSQYPQGVTNDLSALNYASWNGSSWNTQIVDQPISYSDSISLALDSNGNPQIMYGYDTYYPPSGGNTLTVKFANWKGSGWEFETALSDLDYLGNLALDSSGKPHFICGIAFPHESGINSTLLYASWTGLNWSTQVVVSNSVLWFPISTAVVLDSNDYPHIEFFNGSLMYLSWTGVKWNVQTVAPDNFAYGEGPLVLDSHDSPNICYWVDDIHDTTAFVSMLIITTPTPLFTQGPLPRPTASAPPVSKASLSQLWEYSSQGSIISSPIIVDGLIFVSSGTSGGGTQGLYCLNSSNGVEIWSHHGLFVTFTVANGRVYIGEALETPSYSLQGVFSCLNASTGAQLWNFSFGTSFTTPVVGGGVVYVCGYGYTLSTDVNVGSVYSFNASTGKELWSFHGPVGTRFTYEPPILQGANLYALSAAYSSQDASWHGAVYAFNAQTGKELWSYTTSGQFRSLLAVGQNLYVSSNYVDTRGYTDAEKSGGYIYEGGVLALNALSGKPIWDYQVGNSIVNLIFVNSTVYADSGDGVLYTFNAADGKVVWNYTAGTGLGSILSVNGYLYVGSSSGVYCLNANTGAVIWSFSVSDFGDSSPTFPSYADGVIYVGWNGPLFFSHVTQHNFYALQASNGENLWNYTLRYTVASSPMIEKGTVYISCNFVTSRSPDYESSGAVLALKSTIVSLPLESSLPTPKQSIPELSYCIVAVVMVLATTVILFGLKRKVNTS